MTCHGNCHFGQGVNAYAAIRALKQTDNRTKGTTINLLSNQFLGPVNFGLYILHSHSNGCLVKMYQHNSAERFAFIYNKKGQVLLSVA